MTARYRRWVTLSASALRSEPPVDTATAKPVYKRGCYNPGLKLPRYTITMMNKILVSACLMGFKVRYDGSEKAQMVDQLHRWQKEQRLVIHCPELAAGLPTPRPPAEIVSAEGKDVMPQQVRIVEITGQDVTEQYQLGAWLALRTAQESGCTAALLTDGSPTCGSQFIYDGSFSGKRKAGMGIAASLLTEHGIAVFSENRLADLIAWIDEQER